MEKINCQHAERINGQPASRCALGLFQGTPTFGQCVNYCEHRGPIEADGAVILRTGYRSKTGISQASTPRQAGGPGTELKAIFAEMGVKEEEGCGCNALAAQMDQWGVEGCEKRRDEILGLLVARAGAKNMQLDETDQEGLRIAINMAIDQARLKGASAPIP